MSGTCVLGRACGGECVEVLEGWGEKVEEREDNAEEKAEDGDDVRVELGECGGGVVLWGGSQREARGERAG